MKLSRGVGAALVLIGFLAPTAAAHPADFFGWGKNDYLCASSRCTATVTRTGVAIIDEGDLVGFWQNIMSADGFASVCTTNGIDGRFGSRSDSNTRAWQDVFVVGSVDGIVGPETWTTAQQWEVHDFVDTDSKVVYRHYNGAVRDFGLAYPLSQVVPLYWERPAGLVAGSYIGSHHPSITFGTC